VAKNSHGTPVLALLFLKKALRFERKCNHFEYILVEFYKWLLHRWIVTCFETLLDCWMLVIWWKRCGDKKAVEVHDINVWQIEIKVEEKLLKQTGERIMNQQELR